MGSVSAVPAVTPNESGDAGSFAERRGAVRGTPEGGPSVGLTVGSRMFSGILWDVSQGGGRVFIDREDYRNVRDLFSNVMLGRVALRLELSGQGSYAVYLVWFGMAPQGGVIAGVEFAVPLAPPIPKVSTELPLVRVWAVRHRPRREAELAITLGDFFRQLSDENLSLDSALEILCQKAQALVGAEGVIFWALEHEKLIARAQAGRWQFEAGTVLPQGGRRNIPEFVALKKALQRGFQLFANEAQRSVFADHPDVLTFGLKSIMVIPVFGREIDFGALIFGHSENPHAFGAEEQAEAEIFANQAALFLEKAQMVKSLQEWSKFLETMNRISLALHQRLDLDQVLDVICAESQALFQVDIARVFLADNKLDLVDDYFVNHFPNSPTSPHEFIQRYVPKGELQSLMVIGLRDQGELIGALALGDLNNPERFSPQELQKGKLVGEQATRAIVNSRLYERVAQSQRMIRHQDRFRILGELAGVISHEIKNALVPLRTLVDLLPHRYDDAGFREWYAKTVRQEVDRMHALVAQLSRFRRAETRSLESTDPVALLQGVVELMKPESIARQITLDFQSEPLPSVPMVQNELRQVLLNLILNAIQAVEEKGTVRVGVGRAENNRDILFWVSDNGPGIPGDDLEKVFDPLYTTKENGSGLGLAVARDLIEAHGGKIRVESRPGEGSTFTVILPGEDP